MNRSAIERRLTEIEVIAARRLPPPPTIDLPTWLDWCCYEEWTEIENILDRAVDGAFSALDEARFAEIAATGHRRELCWPDLPWEDAITRSGDTSLWRLYGRSYYDRPAGMTKAAWVYAQLEHGG